MDQPVAGLERTPEEVAANPQPADCALLGSLLTRFFRYFAGLRWWETAVTPRDGATVGKVQAWEAMAGAAWMPRTDGGVLMPKLWRMSIIDPFEYTHDLGVVLSESGMAALLRELRRAAHVLSPTQPEVNPNQH